MSSPLSTLVRDGNVAVLTLDSPPVNALGHAVRQAIDAGVAEALADPAVAAVVILCAGRTFFAGADITEFGKPFAAPGLHDIFARLDAAEKPIVAAIHGTALGGGLELALSCHYRLALPTAKLGLPEVALGLLPGAGGTQRTPRLVGVAKALDLIVGGKPVGAAEALRIGLIDRVAQGDDLQAAAIAYARELVASAAPLRRARDLPTDLGPEETAHCVDAFRARHADAFVGFKAPENIVRAIAAASDRPFEAGLAREWELFEALMASVESAAQRHIFFAERTAGKVPVARDAGVVAIARVAVIGAGPMGRDIAQAFGDAGFAVTIVDAETATRDAIGEADLVVEAVAEQRDRTLAVFRQIDAVAKPGAVLATSTALPDLDTIARTTARPADVVGLHFPGPATTTRLVEVVRGAATSDRVIATAMALGRKLGKVAVLAGVEDGFIANRAMAQCAAAADRLLARGVSRAAVDAAMRSYGFSTPAGEAMEPPAAALSPQEIVEYLLYPVVNEGAKLLEEGMALRASDIDMALVAGHGWPVYTGGPMFWGDRQGLARIVAALEAQIGQGAPLTLSALLRARAAAGATLL